MSAPSPVANSLRLSLWLVRWLPKVPPAALDPALAEHLAYIVGLERQGLVLASGPIADPDGTFRGEGMTVLRVGTAERATALADGDPFVVNGLRGYTLHRWTLIEGAIGVTLRFSDSSFTVEGE